MSVDVERGSRRCPRGGSRPPSLVASVACAKRLGGTAKTTGVSQPRRRAGATTTTCRRSMCCRRGPDRDHPLRMPDQGLEVADVERRVRRVGAVVVEERLVPLRRRVRPGAGTRGTADVHPDGVIELAEARHRDRASLSVELDLQIAQRVLVVVAQHLDLRCPTRRRPACGGRTRGRASGACRRQGRRRRCSSPHSRRRSSRSSLWRAPRSARRPDRRPRPGRRRVRPRRDRVARVAERELHRGDVRVRHDLLRLAPRSRPAGATDE